jgi:rRNA maturation RNase YbeY
MSELVLRNRQRIRRVNTPYLRRIVRALLEELHGVEHYELCVHFVGEAEMVRINETFMRHSGTTDVITFDYADKVGRASRPPKPPLKRKLDRRDACPTLHGEIFVSADEAVRQARRFRTSWQSEVVRYVIHGVLHLRGFDDQRATARHKMKREENRLLRELARRFPLTKLAGTPPARGE